MYKIDNGFYSRVKSKMEGNWGNIFAAVITIGLLSGVLNSFVNIPRIASSFRVLMSNGYNADYALNSAKAFSGIDAGTFVSSVISGVLTLSLNMEILRFLKDGNFELSNVFHNITDTSTKILIVGALKGLIEFIFGLVPVIGLVLVIISQLGFAYIAYLLLLNPKKEVIEYFKDSWNLTNGKKIELFKILVHYMLIMFLGSGIVFIGLIIMVFGSSMDSTGIIILSFLVVFIGLIWIIVWSIKNGPYIYLANAMFFDEHMHYEEINLQ